MRIFQGVTGLMTDDVNMVASIESDTLAYFH